jgi:beta-galactosidase
MNKEKFAELFPLGTHLCREPMPAMSEMKRDMENLKKHGFNLIKLQEHWMIDEPAEGRYDFARYEELIDHAAKLDLGIYLGLTCEQAPAWLYRKHPDCRMVGRDGHVVAYEAVTTNPADGKPGPCYDHPGAMADQLRFIRQLVNTLGRHENLVIWNTWQEIGYWAKGLVGNEVCCCPYTLKAFRAWLAEFFGNLERLNKTWNTRYADWIDILPSRTIARRGPFAVDIAWQYFMDNVQVANVLKRRAETIKSSDPLKRPVFAHKGSPLIGAGQDWAYARAQDFLGSSCYPAWGSGLGRDDWKANQTTPLTRFEGLKAEVQDAVSLRFDYLRSCNQPGKPVWAAEFQGGPVSTGFQLGRVPSPEDIRRWMLTAVNSGVTGISFWITRAEISACEMNGFSLLDSLGETTARFEEAARIGRALNRYPELFAKPTLVPARIAIGVSEWNYQTCLHAGCESMETYSVRGWHCLLCELGFPVDFIEINRLGDADVIKPEIIILPFPLALSEATADKLRKFVEQGGKLICEAAPGRITEQGFCNRGELSPVMAELFGVRQTSFKMVREPGNGKRWSPAERTWGEYEEAAMLTGTGCLKGHSLRANVYIETAECLTKETKPCLLYNNKTAGIVRQIGRGQAWLIGTYAGFNGTAYRDKKTRECVRKILEKAGAKPEHDGQLLLRERKCKGREAWIFTNPTEKDLVEKIDVSGWNKVEDLLEGKVKPVSGKVALKVGSLDVRVLVVFN